MANQTCFSSGDSCPRFWERIPIVFLAICLLFGSGRVCANEGWLWFRGGLPSAEAHQSIDILASAASEGLEPADYAAADLARAINRATAGRVMTPEQIAQLDKALTLAVQRYLSDLHDGRVTPRDVHANYSAVKPFDPGAYLRAAVSGQLLGEAVGKAAPVFPAYVKLRKALADYRQLADHPAWWEKLPPLPGRKLEIGRDYAGMPRLIQRLEALGDLPAGTAPSLRYDSNLAEGIKAFQLRHGLEADGVIGARTFEQLQVTPAMRVRQIVLTMERLRWTPLQETRMVVVNIPDFMLRAYEVDGGVLQERFSTKVIVGKAGKTITPVFDRNMRFIEFSPYWNVPRSIARAETVPKLRRSPDYFWQEGFEFVAQNGRVLANLSPENLNGVMQGRLRIRQRPGPENALGGIKFVFPNDDNIYLHDTPAKKLFEQKRRDFSHGCIRVEYPLQLAKFVLKNDPQWDEESILAAMNEGKSRTIRLREPLAVVVAYETAIVGNDERLYFLPDIYGYDQKLDEVLRLRAKAMRSPALP